MKKSLEAQEIVEEIKDMLVDAITPADTVVEILDDENLVVEKSNDLTDEEISKNYESDNEEEDKWDNVQKACWSGYKQVGMKDKGGRMVPNCVPVEKAHDVEDKEEPVKKSIWNGTFIK